ncbi:putative capsid protein [McMurdo Ice Shelf pond-associated circular DNA virus-5]|uniref:putative capsid protein n=1 Tax=McMurdo Ice Shelf pond-associated circular DNA virus-5 TaxID=1521389 RepID=UPI0004D0CA4B|nr:putative capsid protein [McMurdo Ice Shelf pond-associated circular DNA virus-5]AIF71513.1 putative capsid protein [McMurdo Ice Shelf pond-associated circular DNA virus-5]
MSDFSEYTQISDLSTYEWPSGSRRPPTENARTTLDELMNELLNIEEPELSHETALLMNVYTQETLLRDYVNRSTWLAPEDLKNALTSWYYHMNIIWYPSKTPLTSTLSFLRRYRTSKLGNNAQIRYLLLKESHLTLEAREQFYMICQPETHISHYPSTIQQNQASIPKDVQDLVRPVLKSRKQTLNKCPLTSLPISLQVRAVGLFAIERLTLPLASSLVVVTKCSATLPTIPNCSQLFQKQSCQNCQCCKTTLSYTRTITYH